MSLLWGRNAAVTIGRKGTTGTKYKGLRIVFDITKTSEPNPNKAKIQVYGLSAGSRALLQDNQDMVVILEVGYGEDLKRLFIGDIVRAYPTYAGPDIIMNIECGEGEQAINTATIEKSYAGGTSMQEVVKDVTDKMAEAGGIIVSNIKDAVSGKTDNGFTASGMAKDVLSNIVGNQGLEWSVQDNKLRILAPTASTEEEVISLTPTTGLVQTPIKRKDTDGQTIIEFVSLVQHTEVWPGRRVSITSNAVQGVFRVIKAKFKGDTHGDAWYVFAEAI